MKGQSVSVAIVLLLAGPALIHSAEPAAADLIERNRREGSPVWVDGDTATFFYRGPADEVEVIFGGDVQSLSRLAGSDVWTLAVKRTELDRAVFSYRITPVMKMGPGLTPISGVWRGPRAPKPAAESSKLRGTLKEFEIESTALSARRKLTVYLPPGQHSGKANPVIYAADGQGIDRYARVLEPWIDAGKLQPVVLIGVHNGGYAGGAPDRKKYDRDKDFRAQEYFPGINARRFADHESFFCTEVRAWAECQLAVSSERSRRAVFGYSNGGRFAVEMGLRHPEIFGHVFGFSVAGSGKFEFQQGRADLPHFDLMAGTWETNFHRCTSSLANQLRERGVTVHFSARVGGHDPELWCDAFAAAALAAFAKP
jgi:enterochelin esterase-like enzyme